MQTKQGNPRLRDHGMICEAREAPSANARRRHSSLRTQIWSNGVPACARTCSGEFVARALLAGRGSGATKICQRIEFMWSNFYLISPNLVPIHRFLPQPKGGSVSGAFGRRPYGCQRRKLSTCVREIVVSSHRARQRGGTHV